MEYRLKSCAPDTEHHIMMLPQNMAMSSFTPEVRMYRDSSLAPIEEIEDDENVPLEPGVSIAPFGLKQKAKSFKKKTQVLQMEEEEELRLRKEEMVPWVIEDDDQRSFVGKLEGGQQSNYVLFVNQGNEFKVIPASKWYKFVPKIQYHTLTLDEAELKMSSRKKHLDDRWMMHKKVDAVSTEEPVKSKPSKSKSNFDSVDFADEMDFEEVWDDDEGLEVLVDEDDAPKDDAARLIGKSRKKLSNKGKEMKKLVKHLDKGNLYVSDEEKDPYADDFEASDSEEEIHKPTLPTNNDLNMIPKILKRPIEEEKLSSKLPIKKAKPTKEELIKKRIRNSLSVPHSPVPQHSVADTNSNLLTEEDIINALKTGAMKTKELIASIKPKLSKDPRNKDLFPALVKKVAIMKSEDKTLELRDQYK